MPSAEPVTFLHPRRQKERRRGTIGTEHFAEQCERCHPVHVVIAVENDLLRPVDRMQDSIDRRAHLAGAGRDRSNDANAAGGNRSASSSATLFCRRRAIQGRAQISVGKFGAGETSSGADDPAAGPFHCCTSWPDQDGRAERIVLDKLSAGGAAGSNCCCRTIHRTVESLSLRRQR